MADQDYTLANDLLEFIDAAPSPWHAAAIMAAQLQGMGFESSREDTACTLRPGGDYFVRRGGASLVAFRVGSDPAGSGLRIIGAHTDSPSFRVRPEAAGRGRQRYGDASHRRCRGLWRSHRGQLCRP
ncbi:MAG: hypothetical protein U5L11_13520 [Arhodomonas sp.]|nr:hypothetical protein [Arhodomonas sp.]